MAVSILLDCVAARKGWPGFCSCFVMDTLNDLDLAFLLIDILVVVAGVFAVAAWFVDHRRNAQRQRDRRPMFLQSK